MAHEDILSGIEKIALTRKEENAAFDVAHSKYELRADRTEAEKAKEKAKLDKQEKALEKKYRKREDADAALGTHELKKIHAQRTPGQAAWRGGSDVALFGGTMGALSGLLSSKNKLNTTSKQIIKRMGKRGLIGGGIGAGLGTGVGLLVRRNSIKHMKEYGKKSKGS
jgi:hypothetical protein